MQIGAMNNPKVDVHAEIRAIAELGFEFLDLTLEPPGAASWVIDPQRLRHALEEARLNVVGHTAYYLPIASPFAELRHGAVSELTRCLHAFAEIGARWMNVHPDRYAPQHDRAFFIQRNLESLRELLEAARKIGIGLMIENLPGDFNTAAQLGELLDPLPDLGLHLDIGHANLLVPANTTGDIVNAYGSRLRHVHLHDNRGGGEDMHLPLGAGTVDVAGHLRLLRSAGYDGTITLEVFTRDRHFLAYSREKLRTLWDAAG